MVRCALALLAIFSAACAGVDRGHADESTLTILVEGDEHVLSLAWDIPAKFLIFLPLVAKNTEGELEGVLATHWEHSADFHTWTVHLRNDVYWHDGVPFTARDVKFTLELLAHPEVLWASPDAYEVSVIDDTTYTIVYRTYGPGSPLDDWTVYYPRHLLEQLDPAAFEDWEFWLAPVGNGPYRYVRTVPQTMMGFEANPSFYRGRARIDRIVFKFGPPHITELLSGAVDILSYANAIDVLTMGDDPRFHVYHTFELMNGDVILWNQRRPPFNDARVRRGITHAIDRRELHSALNLPEGTPIFDGKFTERQFRRGELPEPLAYDTALAVSLLAEAGWSGELRFTALVPPMFQLEDAAVFVQDQLRKVGVRMEIESGDFSYLMRQITAGDFDAVFVRTPLSGEWAGMRFYETGSPIAYEDPRVVELLEQIRNEVDPEGQDQLHQEIMTIFQRDVPATHLGPGVAFMIAHRGVHGLSSPFGAYPFAQAFDLWLEDER